ncbi:ABC transporter ATP-binding protein [Verrucosispora sp. WMMC514]|uniref:ABC transporter ATP-binding protein n=1 Tax=Verrucosispora sp. WMMC514 TaxID=3015156 RepID=UPI00248BDA4B|nr:ABC transporter ATP-binding protein [Verrucosispora sp. WMMC514]WBB93382.1 ABC transporter ATP-binding protein [Verrucosispora sp. WMMC514]
MRPIDVELPSGRRQTLTPDRPWTVVLAGPEPTIVPGDGPIDGSSALGVFWPFGEWVFNATEHQALSRMQLNSADIVASATVRLAGCSSVSLTGLFGPPPPSATPPLPPHALSGLTPAPSTDHWHTVGRVGTGADFEVDDPTVLAGHAKVRRDADGEWLIVAVRGRVFVDGISCSSAPVRPGSPAIVGQSFLSVADLEAVLQDPPAVPATASSSGLSVSAAGLCVHNGRRPTLTGLTFKVVPGTLVAVIGPSGAGKSTLLGAVLGGRRITDGELRVGGVLLRSGRNQRLLQHLVRFVPQRDDLYGELTVTETLDGAARLRLATDATTTERHRRVDEAIDVLGLEHRRNARVDDLSGGERRRVSIGIELVGRPRLLLLDEPTSGLDLALDRELMRTLRRISRAGCTVVINTHTVAHVAEADQVLLLNAGGRLARAGRPDEFVVAAAETGWTDLLEAAGRRNPEADRERQAPRRPWLRLPQPPLGRQFTVLLRRGPWYGVGTLALPLGGAAVAAAAGGLRADPNLTQVLAILVTVAALSGTALTYLDIVTCEAIFKRDWRAGVRPGKLVLTLSGAYIVVCAGLAAVMTVAFLTRRDGFAPAFGVPPVTSLFVVLFLLLVASMALGVLISAAARTVPQAVTASTVLAIAQVVLNGSLFHLPAWLAAPAVVLPARLGLAAAGGYADLNAQRRGRLYTDAMWRPEAWRYWAMLAALIAVTAGALWLAATLLRTRWHRKIE